MFLSVEPRAFCRRERHIVDFRIRAPVSASRGGDLELPWQIVEIRVSRKCPRDLLCDRRGIKNLVTGNSGQRTSGHISHYIAASAFWTEFDRGERVHGLH